MESNLFIVSPSLSINRLPIIVGGHTPHPTSSATKTTRPSKDCIALIVFLRSSICGLKTNNSDDYDYHHRTSSTKIASLADMVRIQGELRLPAGIHEGFMMLLVMGILIFVSKGSAYSFEVRVPVTHILKTNNNKWSKTDAKIDIKSHPSCMCYHSDGYRCTNISQRSLDRNAW